MWNELWNRPAVVIVLSIIIGIALFRFTSSLILPIIIGILILLFINEKVSFFLLIILLSSYWTSKNWEDYIRSTDKIKSFESSYVEVKGRVKEILSKSILIDMFSINSSSSRGVIEVMNRDNEELEYDEIVLINGKIYTNKNIDLNGRQIQKRIIGVVYPESIEVMEKSRVSLKRWLSNLRERIQEHLKGYFSKEEGEVLSAMVLGIDKDVSYDIYRKFKVTGLIHTLVASGAQVSIITSILLPFLSKTWTLTVFPIILMYSFIAGFGVSILRATIMMSISILARIIKEDYDPLSSLAFSGILILLFDPISLFGTSFQLSFLATFALIGISPYIKIRYLDFALPNITVQTILSPLLLYRNGNIPLISFLINILVAPIISLITILGFIVVLSTFTFPFITLVLSFIIKPVLYILLAIIEWGNFKTYGIDYSPNILELIAIYIILGGLLYIAYTRLHRSNK
ncbi:MAG: ComEC/Rec2 family competence protein [bacterium]